MNRGLQIFSRRLRLMFRITTCCCRANFGSGGHSSMLSTKETPKTPKKLAAVLEQKKSSCSGDCCRLCECLFKVQKRRQISAHIHGKLTSTSREERCWETASGKTFIRRSGTSPFRVISRESVRSVHLNFGTPLSLSVSWKRNYHRFRWNATLENKTPAETDRNPPITAR